MLRNWFFAHARRLRILLNFWPPFLFSGIKVTELSSDFRYCKVILKDWPGTRNANLSQFGGSLFSMTDPIYSLMLMGILGNQYYIWDKSAHIDFKKPGIGVVYAESFVDDDMIAAIHEHTQNGKKYFPQVVTQIKDTQENIIATVTRTLYIRLKPQYRPQPPKLN